MKTCRACKWWLPNNPRRNPADYAVLHDLPVSWQACTRNEYDDAQITVVRTGDQDRCDAMVLTAPTFGCNQWVGDPGACEDEGHMGTWVTADTGVNIMSRRTCIRCGLQLSMDRLKMQSWGGAW